MELTDTDLRWRTAYSLNYKDNPQFFEDLRREHPKYGPSGVHEYDKDSCINYSNTLFGFSEIPCVVTSGSYWGNKDDSRYENDSDTPMPLFDNESPMPIGLSQEIGRADASQHPTINSIIADIFFCFWI